jgi:hypothetical protein
MIAAAIAQQVARLTEVLSPAHLSPAALAYRACLLLLAAAAAFVTQQRGTAILAELHRFIVLFRRAQAYTCPDSWPGICRGSFTQA